MKQVSLTCLVIGALALPLTTFAQDGAGSDDAKTNTTNPNIGKTPSNAAGGMINTERPAVNSSQGSSTGANGSSTATSKGANNAKESLENKESAPREGRERSDQEKAGE